GVPANTASDEYEVCTCVSPKYGWRKSSKLAHGWRASVRSQAPGTASAAVATSERMRAPQRERRVPRCIMVARFLRGEQPLAARAAQQRVDRAAVVRRQRRMALAQPPQALALIGERPLGPRAAIDGALDPVRAAVERIGVGDQEGHVDAPDLLEQRS